MDTSRKLFGAVSTMPVLLRNDTLPSPSHLLDSFWIPDSSPTFHGVVGGEERKDRAFFQPLQEEENGEEDLEGCFHRTEKKRRLTVGQVQFLERSFEVENKLEPERKNQLAKELGLQPRQVAIWFQNRRARFKTKQLEKDYDSLKACYDTLKANYDRLLKDKEKLTSQVILLREKAEAGEGISPSEKAGIPNACKQEDASSAKSDVYDPDSPLYTEGNHSSLVLGQEPEPEQSEFSQEEEEDSLNLGNPLIMPPCFPKLEDCSYHDLDHHPPLGLMPAAEEQHPIWFWSY